VQTTVWLKRTRNTCSIGAESKRSICNKASVMGALACRFLPRTQGWVRYSIYWCVKFRVQSAWLITATTLSGSFVTSKKVFFDLDNLAGHTDGIGTLSLLKSIQSRDLVICPRDQEGTCRHCEPDWPTQFANVDNWGLQIVQISEVTETLLI
jgi:hypothetical protein